MTISQLCRTYVFFFVAGRDSDMRKTDELWLASLRTGTIKEDQGLTFLLPSPCTAFSQAPTINSFWSCNRGEQPSHVTRNGLTEKKDRERPRN